MLKTCQNQCLATFNAESCDFSFLDVIPHSMQDVTEHTHSHTHAHTHTHACVRVSTRHRSQGQPVSGDVDSSSRLLLRPPPKNTRENSHIVFYAALLQRHILHFYSAPPQKAKQHKEHCTFTALCNASHCASLD